MLLDNKDYLQRAPHWPSSSQGCSIRPLSRPIIQLLLSHILFKEPSLFTPLVSKFQKFLSGVEMWSTTKMQKFWKLSRRRWCWWARQSDKYPNHGNEGQLRETQDQMQIHMQISIQTQITKHMKIDRAKLKSKHAYNCQIRNICTVQGLLDAGNLFFLRLDWSLVCGLLSASSERGTFRFCKLLRDLQNISTYFRGVCGAHLPTNTVFSAFRFKFEMF